MEIGGHEKIPIQGREMTKMLSEALSNQLHRTEDSVRSPWRITWHSEGQEAQGGSPLATLPLPLSIASVHLSYSFIPASPSQPQPSSSLKVFQFKVQQAQKHDPLMEALFVLQTGQPQGNGDIVCRATVKAHRKAYVQS